MVWRPTNYLTQASLYTRLGIIDTRAFTVGFVLRQ